MIESSCSLIGECMDGKEKYTFNHKTECFLLKRQTDKKEAIHTDKKKDTDKKGNTNRPCQGHKGCKNTWKKAHNSNNLERSSHLIWLQTDINKNNNDADTSVNDSGQV